MKLLKAITLASEEQELYVCLRLIELSGKHRFEIQAADGLGGYINGTIIPDPELLRLIQKACELMQQ